MRTIFATLAVATTAAAAAAQTPPPPKPLGCAGAEHRQLDFWVGEWRVFQGDTEIAESRIEPVAEGCAISENYWAPKAPGGPYRGLSYSAFDSKAGKWRQFYVDVNGAATWYTGGLEGADMVLHADGPNGAKLRMSYSPLPDGAVRQTGKRSTDGGQTWVTGYDYVYRRR